MMNSFKRGAFNFDWKLIKDQYSVLRRKWQVNIFIEPIKAIPVTSRRNLHKRHPHSTQLIKAENEIRNQLVISKPKVCAKGQIRYLVASTTLTDLMKDQVHAMFTNIKVNDVGLVNQGKLGALAMVSPMRSPLLPEVPNLVNTSKQS
jgi:Tripartite tricarboxylate transporter family receptor